MRIEDIEASGGIAFVGFYPWPEDPTEKSVMMDDGRKRIIAAARKSLRIRLKMEPSEEEVSARLKEIGFAFSKTPKKTEGKDMN